MARQQHQNTLTVRIGFKSVQLLKDQTLGIGSYGIVCKALCDDLLCAAKIIHPTLFNPNAHQQIEHQREHRLPIRRFMQECEFMSAIKHPNIVQFLRTHHDPQTGLPVLLMELMDDNLTHYLESSQDAVPYHIQVNFCHDITLAISYLHSNRITHRDLSSNNVLLHGNVIAKVTDFGMAKLSDINPKATHASFTQCPGTDVYMPPEALKQHSVYSVKFDCFAIGTLVIQILTRCFPKPGDRLKTIQIDHPQHPSGRTVYEPIPEVERRQNHISLVDPNHPLLPIALDCLKDSDAERPSAQELCYRVGSLKDTLQFTQSVKRAQERPKLRQQVQDKDDTTEQTDKKKDRIRQEHVQQIQGLQQIIESQKNRLQQKDAIIQEKNDIIQDKSDIVRNKERTIAARQQECQQLRGTIRDQQRQLQQVTQQLESNQHVTAQFQTQIHELEQQLKRLKTPTEVLAKPQPSFRDPPQTHHSDTSTRTATATRDSLTLRSREGKKTPWKVVRGSNVVDGEMVYHREGFHHSDTSTRTVTATRDSFTLRWREGKKAPCKVVRGSNVVDGEMVYYRAGIHSIYAYNSRKEAWEELPDCPYSFSSLVVIQNSLTVIGGNDKITEGSVTNELLTLREKGRSKRWIAVFPPMPTKRLEPIAMCTGHALIVAGGWGEDRTTLRTVEIMSIDTKQWSSAADLPEPLTKASATICHKCIYIGGGRSNRETFSKSVYTCTLADLFLSCKSRSLRQHLAQSLPLTSPHRSTVWNRVADLPATQCACVTLHNRLLAIGGWDSKDEPTSGVYQYHPTSNTWECISQMMTSRRQCFAAVLPTNELMVVGGCTDKSLASKIDSVEIATVFPVSGTKP